MAAITKTVWQYSEKLSEETMESLRFLAWAYNRVKNDVYKRYSGIRNVNRLTPYYNIMGEMRRCGLREQTGLPSTYYDAAVADAVGDIKGNWGVLKRKIGERISANENLNAEERKYLRTVLKVNSIYEAILNRQEYTMPENCKDLTLDIKKLNNLLCRLTRKYLTVPEAKNTGYFGMTKDGYCYKNKTIRITSMISRQRISIPVKDGRTSSRQLKLYVKEDYVAIAMPVETKIREHADYCGTVYIHIGGRDMLTLSNGRVYGQGIGDIVDPETERLARKNASRRRMQNVCRKSMAQGEWKKARIIENNNLGKIKYNRQKERERARTTTFINGEINRMLKQEKPERIVITRPVKKNRTDFHVSAKNRKMSRNFRGYIRERLLYKCQGNSVEVEEINSKGTGNICSRCGEEGERRPEGFVCAGCGLRISIALNCAKNIEKKYTECVTGTVTETD